MAESIQTQTNENSTTAIALDRRTIELVKLVILKLTKDKKRWLARGTKTEILAAGYSELIASKARQYDLNESRKIAVINAILWSLLYLLPGGSIWMALVAAIFIFNWIQSCYYYRKSKLSHADDLLVLQELTEKLDPNLVKYGKMALERPLLERWREGSKVSEQNS